MSMPADASAFVESLAQLAAALADADPLTGVPAPGATGGARMSVTAGAVAEAFATAAPDARPRYLLRALDQAIGAVEVAALLAEQLAGAVAPVTDAAAATGPVAAAYVAFATSQPAYAPLYHYRNALAASLRAEPRVLPEAVARADMERVVEAPDDAPRH